MGDSAGGKEVGRISIRVVPDLDRFYRDLKEGVEAAEKGNKAKIEVLADMDGFRKKVAAETSNLKDAKVKVKADVDKSDFLALLAETKAAARDANVKVNIDFQDAEAEAKLAATIAKLKAEAKASNIKLKVDVDTDAVQRGLSSAGGGAAGMLSSLPNLSHGMLIFGAVVAFAAPALALLSGALLTLPALLTAILVPIGAVALGMDGLKKAAENAGLLGEGKKGKTKLGATLKELQTVVSSGFEKGFTPVFQQIASLIPTLASHLPNVVTGLSQMASAFTSTLASQSGMTRIGSTIDSIGKALGASSPGIANFTDGMLTLVDKVAAKLPSLSKMFNGWGESFSKWITKITLPDWITGKSKLDTGLSTFKDTLKTVLDLVGDLAKKGFEWLSDPKFGDKMKDFVKDIQTLVNDVLPALAGAFKDLATIVNGITKITEWKPPEWMRGNADGHKDNPQGIPSKSAPANKDKPIDMLDVGALFATIPGTLGLIFKDQIVSALKSIDFASIWTSIKSVDWMTVLGLSTVPTMIMTVLSSIPWDSMWSGLTTAAQTAWTNVTAVISTAVGDALAVVMQIPSQLGSIWNSIPAAASQAWSMVTSIISAAIAAFVAVVNNGVQQVLGFFKALPGQIAGALSGAAGALAGAGRALMDGLLSGIKSGLASVLAFASSIAGQIAAVKGPLPKDRTTLVPAGQALMQGLQDGLEGGLEGVLGRARSIAQQIAEAMNGGIVGGDLKNQLKKSLDELELERKQLKVQYDQTTDKGERKSLKDQMAQIGVLKDQLGLQSNQLGFSKKYGDQVDSNTQMMQGAMTKMIGIGSNFAQSNANQFMQDLGISGRGAIPTIANQGLSWMTGLLSKAISGGGVGGTTQIHVNSVDEALSARQNLVNKQALQFS